MGGVVQCACEVGARGVDVAFKGFEALPYLPELSAEALLLTLEQ